MDIKFSELTDYITENSRSQKLVRAIKTGYNSHIKNFGIVSPENPMGVEADAQYNNEKVREMKRTLNSGNYNFLKVKGQYNSPERSFLIYNCVRTDIERFAYEYEQQAYVWAVIEGGKVHSEIWSRQSEEDEYTLEVSRDYVIDAASDKDFFSQIAGKLKFRLPFYDEPTQEEHLRAMTQEEEETLAICTNPKYTGRARYLNRSRFNQSYYGQKNRTSL